MQYFTFSHNTNFDRLFLRASLFRHSRWFSLCVFFPGVVRRVLGRPEKQQENDGQDCHHKEEAGTNDNQHKRTQVEIKPMIDTRRIGTIPVIEDLHFVADGVKRRIRFRVGMVFTPLSLMIRKFNDGAEHGITVTIAAPDDFDDRSVRVFGGLNKIASVLPPHHSGTQENHSRQSKHYDYHNDAAFGKLDVYPG